MENIENMNCVKDAAKYNKLVYDVGMHKGEDTDYYLRKGFRVIGFEANPDLSAYCRTRFKDDIEQGKLIIVEGAIAEVSPGVARATTIKFYRNKDNSIWGTAVGSWADRNELFGTSSELIEVPVIDFTECLAEYGIPHYLKIDIEGMDRVCLRALMHFEQKPDYVSIESEKVSFENLVEELNLFRRLGYTAFKAIQQKTISRQIEPKHSMENEYVGYTFTEGSSGLFGSDLPYKWKNYSQILDEYKWIFLQYKIFGDYGIMRKHLFGKVFREVLRMLLRMPLPGWYDTHARHSSVVS
jgi:FkbM family methyltransferase